MNDSLETAVLELCEQWQHICAKHQLSDVSLHITPDLTWVAKEHELEDNRLIRKAPGCHEVILKL